MRLIGSISSAARPAIFDRKGEKPPDVPVQANYFTLAFPMRLD
jgi:hypothetical protein